VCERGPICYPRGSRANLTTILGCVLSLSKGLSKDGPLPDLFRRNRHPRPGGRLRVKADIL
jgi:hypothetical protein